MIYDDDVYDGDDDDDDNDDDDDDDDDDDGDDEDDDDDDNACSSPMTCLLTLGEVRLLYFHSLHENTKNSSNDKEGMVLLFVSVSKL